MKSDVIINMVVAGCFAFLFFDYCFGDYTIHGWFGGFLLLIAFFRAVGVVVDHYTNEIVD